MDLSSYPPELRKYLAELIRRKTISKDGLNDKTLINYLSTQIYDESYIDSIFNDRDHL